MLVRAIAPLALSFLPSTPPFQKLGLVEGTRKSSGISPRLWGSFTFVGLCCMTLPSSLSLLVSICLCLPFPSVEVW